MWRSCANMYQGVGGWSSSGRSAHDDDGCAREKSALDDLGGDRIIRVREGDDWRAALSRTLGEPSLSINGVLVHAARISCVRN